MCEVDADFASLGRAISLFISIGNTHTGVLVDKGSMWFFLQKIGIIIPQPS